MAASALGHAASGSLGTALATAAVAPLDLITTRLKTQHLDLDDAATTTTTKYSGVLDALRKILREEGPSALYASAGADISKSILDSFLFFGFYNYLRPRKPTTVLQEIVLGSVAGAASKAITTPLSNVVARKQTLSPDDSFIQILRELKKEGGLWAGYSATLVLTLNPSLTFLVNRRLAERVLPEGDGEDVAWAAFLLAAVSKAFATGVMYPFQAAKTRLQLNVDEEDEKKKRVKGLVGKVLEWLRGTIFGVIVGIGGREGVRALYAGMQGELLKGFFSHGLTMLAKGLVHRLMVKMWAKRGVIKTVR